MVISFCHSAACYDKFQGMDVRAKPLCRPCNGNLFVYVYLETYTPHRDDGHYIDLCEVLALEMVVQPFAVEGHELEQCDVYLFEASGFQGVI